MAETRTPKEIEAAERKAMADAEAAERDLIKRQIEEESLQVDLDRKKKELEEWIAGRQRREVEASANALALQLKNDDAERAGIKDLVPDLIGVDKGSTTVPETSTVFQALLGGRALQDAARKLISVVKGSTGLGDDYKVLLTTDLELAARDASYLSVVDQLAYLKQLIDQFRSAEEGDFGSRALAPGVKIATAAAKVLPGLLSLISAKRTITTSASAVDDDTALMAVAGVLAGADAEAMVVVEKARLLGRDGPAQTSWTELQTACLALANELEQGEEPDADWVAEAKALLKTCQTALAAMTTVPENSKLSPLALAALQEALHSEDFDGVLVVKGGASSATQLVDDRPLRFGDPLSVVCTATISYLLIDHRSNSKVLGGGLAHGAAQVHGKIGRQLSLPQ